TVGQCCETLRYGDATGNDMCSQNRQVERCLMVDQRFQKSHAEEPACLAADVEERNPISNFPPMKIKQRDQRDRQKEETECEAAQQNRRHQVRKAAFAA